MAKLSDAMVKALREIAADGTATFSERTAQALRRRWMIADVPGGFRLTQTGRAALAELERAERAAQESAERLSRPVPAQIGEPSAARPLVLDTDMGNGCDCDQDGCPVCFPEPAVPGVSLDLDTQRMVDVNGEPTGHKLVTEPSVPQAWIDQLVTLLDAGGRIVKREQGWRVDQRPGSLADAFLYQWERLDAAATEAIRRGIAEALPPTPGGGVVRLALTDAFRARRAMIAADGCDACSVEPGEAHRYPTCPGIRH